MKSTLLILSLLVYSLTFAQYPKVKVGGGLIPSDTVFPTKVILKDHWSIGPWTMLGGKNKYQQRTRTNYPLLGVHDDCYQSNSYVPADNSIAISKRNLSGFWDRQVVCASNGKMEFYAENGNFIQDFDWITFVNNPTSCPIPNGFFDPRVIYDPVGDRFMVIILYQDDQNTNLNSKIVICVSHNGDPGNGFEVFTIDAPSGYWYDYPNIGMSTNDLFITVNKIVANSGSMTGTDIYQIPKSDLFSGITGSVVVANLFTDIKDYDLELTRGIVVATAGAPQLTNFGPGAYLISNNMTTTPPWQTKATLYDITDDYIGAPVLNKYSYTYPNAIFPPSSGMQLNSSNRLSCGGTIVQSAYYLNGNIHLTLNGALSSSNNQSAIYYARLYLSTVSADVALITPNTLAGDKEHLAYPSICHMGIDIGDKSSAVTYLETSQSWFPSINAILYDDNMIPSSVAVFRQGDGYISQNGISTTSPVEIRWGDYTGIQRVYDNPCPQFINAGSFGNLLNNTQTFFNISRCETEMVNELYSFDKLKIYPNPTMKDISVEFYSSTFDKCRIELRAIDGRLINAKSLIVNSGLNKIDYSLDNLSKGIYLLTLFNPTSNEHLTTKIIKE